MPKRKSSMLEEDGGMTFQSCNNTIIPNRPVRVMHSINGTGLLSGLKNFFKGPRKSAPPKVRNFLTEHSNDQIVKAYISRTPLKAPIAKAANWLTRGKYEQKRKEAGYDDFYHTAMIFELANGKKFRLEKNHVVEISDYKPKSEQVLPIHLSKPISVSEMIINAEKYQKKNDDRPNFWTYDAQNNNCQYFVDDIIKGNPEFQNPDRIEKFTIQPEGKEAIDPAKGIVKTLTDIAGRADHAIHGSGSKRRKLIKGGKEDPIPPRTISDDIGDFVHAEHLREDALMEEQINRMREELRQYERKEPIERKEREVKEPEPMEVDFDSLPRWRQVAYLDAMERRQRKKKKETARKRKPSIDNSYEEDLKRRRGGSLKHPGFHTEALRISRKEHIPLKRANAILASSSRRASTAAHKSNPRLNRVGSGAKVSKVKNHISKLPPSHKEFARDLILGLPGSIEKHYKREQIKSKRRT